MKAERIANALGRNAGTGRTAGCPTHDDRPARIERFSSAPAARDATRQPGQDSAQRRWTVLRSWKPIRKGALIGFELNDASLVMDHWMGLFYSRFSILDPLLKAVGIATIKDASNGWIVVIARERTGVPPRSATSSGTAREVIRL